MLIGILTPYKNFEISNLFFKRLKFNIMADGKVSKRYCCSYASYSTKLFLNVYASYSTKLFLNVSLRQSSQKLRIEILKLEISTFLKKLKIEHYARGQWGNFKTRSPTVRDLFNRTFSTNSLWQFS